MKMTCIMSNPQKGFLLLCSTLQSAVWICAPQMNWALPVQPRSWPFSSNFVLARLHMTQNCHMESNDICLNVKRTQIILGQSVEFDCSLAFQTHLPYFARAAVSYALAASTSFVNKLICLSPRLTLHFSDFFLNETPWKRDTWHKGALGWLFWGTADYDLFGTKPYLILRQPALPTRLKSRCMIREGKNAHWSHPSCFWRK